MDNNLVNAVQAVDNTFLLIFGISAALLVMIAATMVWFVVRYSRKNNPEPSQIHGNMTAEIIWIVLPTLLVMGMFWSGWHSYRALRDAPEGAMEVKVTARMWSWDFEYPNGRHSGTLVVPVGKPVKLALTSVDVIHGFFAPAFRLKIDTVPGMITHGWFRADKEGEYVIFCSVYCGLQHAKMLSAIRAVGAEDFERFLNEKPAGSGHPGKALLDAKGCLGCHTLDGTASVGPSLKGVFGREAVLVAPDKRERRVKLDTAGLHMMIMGPRLGVAKGFEPVMPLYNDQLSEEEFKQIVDFLEHGEQAPDGPEAGRAVAEAQGCMGCHSTDGTEIVGPSFKGMFGKKGLAKDHAVVDRPYVEAVLLDPAGRLGKPSSMPAFPGLSATEREGLMKFLESLSDAPPPAPMGPESQTTSEHPAPGHDMPGHDMSGHDGKEHK